MQINVLVTGTSSYGVGEGLLKVILESKYRDKVRIIAASNSALTAFKNLVDKYYILPSAKNHDYLSALLNLVTDEKIHIFIPGSEAEMEIVSQNMQQFTHLDVWLNPVSIVKLFNNKINAHQFFSHHGFTTPEMVQSNLVPVFPVICKPTQGKSSEGIYIARNESQLQAIKNFYQAFNVECLIQEFIPEGDEYTVSLINLRPDKQEVFIMKRILNKGATQFVTYEENPYIKDIALKFHDILKNELILNLQFIKKNDKYYIIEVNPRFSGSAPMRAKLGFNEFDIIFAEKYLDQSHNYSIQKNDQVIRGYQEVLYPN